MRSTYGKRLARIKVRSILGKPIPKGAEIHHCDENQDNNENSNLVLCQDGAYHKLLHMRMQALKESGNVHNRKCTYCGNWDSPDNLYIRKNSSGRGYACYHPACSTAYNLKYYNKVNHERLTLAKLRQEIKTTKKAICACGCGQEFLSYDSRGRLRKYIHGHNNRIYSIAIFSTEEG